MFDRIADLLVPVLEGACLFQDRKPDRLRARAQRKRKRANAAMDRGETKAARRLYDAADAFEERARILEGN